MVFTALHRLLGLPPGPITDEMIDRAVEEGLAETDDLDWKGALPPTKALSSTDFPKDVAAMANSGGGVIVYGVEESQKRASGRRGVGELTENHERTLQAAAISAVSPPVFGMTVHRTGGGGNEAVAVVVPASPEAPHMIFRDQFFGVPMRNDADTVWMSERLVERAYRTRFAERERSRKALEELYAEALDNWARPQERVWFVAVARPTQARTPAPTLRRSEALRVFERARTVSDELTSPGPLRPLDSVERYSLRRGLRRWVAFNTQTEERSLWKAAWMSVHEDGSISIAAAMGGARLTSDGWAPVHVVESGWLEAAVADLMALVRASSEDFGLQAYNVLIGVEHAASRGMQFGTMQHTLFSSDYLLPPIQRFSRIASTVSADSAFDDFLRQTHDLALDCVNQGGVGFLVRIPTPRVE